MPKRTTISSTTSRATEARSRVEAHVALLMAALVILTLLTYLGTVKSGFILVDDDEYVEKNPNIQAGLSWRSISWAFTHRHSAMYHPVTTISHMADVQLFGLDPHWHHFENAIFHAINGALLLLALQQMTCRLWPSAFVAAVFALHPQHVESVAWISERKDLLSGLFLMLCLLAYVYYVRGPSASRYLLVLFLFVLGLLSKPMLVTVPAVLILIDLWPFKRPRSIRLIIEKIPLVMLAMVFASVAVYMQRAKGALSFDVPLSDRIENAVLSYVRYVGVAFWPSQLSFVYPHPFPNRWPTEFVVSALISLVLFTTVVTLTRRSHPAVMFGWLWFLVMLVPVLGIVQVGRQAMADRYSYLPSIGLMVAFTWFAADVLPIAKHRRIFACGVGLLLLICMVRTFTQVQYWRDEDALYESSLDSTESSFVRNVLAWRFFLEGQPDLAIENYNQVLSYEPYNQVTRAKLGAVLLHEGRLQESRANLLLAIQLDPNEQLSYIFLAGLCQAEGNIDAAIEAAHKAVQLDSEDPDAREILRKLNAIRQQPSPRDVMR